MKGGGGRGTGEVNVQLKSILIGKVRDPLIDLLMLWLFLAKLWKDLGSNIC